MDYLPTDSDDDEEENGGQWCSNTKKRLSEWAINYNISHAALSALLDILRDLEQSLPKDPRTLLSTPVCADMRGLAGGSYYHFGVAQSLCSQLSKLSQDSLHGVDTLTLQINIDGLPLFKSSLQTLWPIFAIVKELPEAGVFMIGVYGGTSKPTSVHDYLEQFIHDLKDVCGCGVQFNNKHYKVALPDAFMCDAPARAFLKCVKGHTGYFGCERCVRKGVSVAHRMTFPEISAAPRTNVRFAEMMEGEYQVEQSPLIGLGIGCITDFVLDYMHLVCLGVVRRLIFFGPQVLLKVISDELVAVRKCLPREFCRKPRAFQEYKLWKATEFRQFLLYTGPVVLRNKLPNNLYRNFMVLSYSMRLLLSSQKISAKYADYVEALMKVFVQNFATLYGRDMVVYNVHNFIHLADDARKYGFLDAISCFPFENYLGKLKRMVRKGQSPLSQIVKRVAEMQKLDSIHTKTSEMNVPLHKKAHFSGPVPLDCGSCLQYKQYLDPRFLISCKGGDNCFEVNEKVLVVRNILCSSSRGTLIIYEEYKNCETAFDYPGDSLLIGVKSVSKFSGQLHVASPENVTRKLVLLPLREKYIVFPMLHTI